MPKLLKHKAESTVKTASTNVRCKMCAALTERRAFSEFGCEACGYCGYIMYCRKCGAAMEEAFFCATCKPTLTHRDRKAQRDFHAGPYPYKRCPYLMHYVAVGGTGPTLVEWVDWRKTFTQNELRAALLDDEVRRLALAFRKRFTDVFEAMETAEKNFHNATQNAGRERWNKIHEWLTWSTEVR